MTYKSLSNLSLRAKGKWKLIWKKITVTAGLHEGGSGERLSASLSVPLKWASTSVNPVAQCRYEPTLHALFFQAALAQCPIRVAVLFTSGRFLLLVFRSRVNLVERQIGICIVIGCRLPDGAEITHAGSAFCRWITRSWDPLDGHFERFFSENQMFATRVNSI